MNLKQYSHIYFIGIGGIGMSAIARYCNSYGFQVSGFDKTASPLTDELKAEGMAIHFEDNINLIGEDFKNSATTLVVYTPAVPAHHSELNYFRENGFAVHKRSEVLAALCEGKTTIAVAGTHGKTSTATCISHILKTAGVPFYGLLGGIAANYSTNFIDSETKDANLIVVEADEYDRSFHRLFPDVAAITSIEPDHLDIYGTFEELEKAYFQFASQVKTTLLLQDRVGVSHNISQRCTRYGLEKSSAIRAENIRVENGKFVFDAIVEDLVLPNIELGVPGNHNIENALAAIDCVKDFVKDSSVYYEALKTFRGVKRRFEIIISNDNCLFVDDYAHHPTEIEVTIKTLRMLYPNKEIWGVFQPHLFSRTKDLADGFAQALSLLDKAYLLPIYPARELPMEGVTSELIYNKISNGSKRLLEKEELLADIEKYRPEVFVTIGAGDIDRLVPQIKSILSTPKMATL
ncbi:MAG: UDP-N-acetylmuramate--L-alanine ligase [Bacteroidetes bacterium]|nr:UDP-N-acetylmuramate--L-alanine ligase [Bacteroidota bacterium]